MPSLFSFVDETTLSSLEVFDHYQNSTCPPVGEHQRATGSYSVSANSLGMYEGNDNGNIVRYHLHEGNRKSLLQNRWHFSCTIL